MKRFEYVRVSSAAEAAKLLGDGVTLKAGGTDVLVLLKDRISEPNRIVNLEDASLRKLEVAGGVLKIGALVTMEDICEHPDVKKHAPSLAHAAHEAATPQVRTMATLGGNLCQRPRCWYYRMPEIPCLKKGGSACPAIEGDNRYHAIFGDARCPIVHPSNLGPPLVALGAKIHTLGRTLAAEEFFTADRIDAENSLKPGEIITSVEIPTGWKNEYVEARERQSFDWPLASVTAAKKDKEIRIVFGAVAPRPWRIAEVEKAVMAGDVKKAQEIIASEAKPLSKNGYKVQILQALLPRALEALR